MDRIVGASTDPGDVVWEPFGGLCTATLSAVNLGRRGYAAEIDPNHFDLAQERFRDRVPALFEVLP
jgi:DNA modification methylase